MKRLHLCFGMAFILTTSANLQAEDSPYINQLSIQEANQEANQTAYQRLSQIADANATFSVVGTNWSVVLIQDNASYSYPSEALQSSHVGQQKIPAFYTAEQSVNWAPANWSPVERVANGYAVNDYVAKERAANGYVAKERPANEQLPMASFTGNQIGMEHEHMLLETPPIAEVESMDYGVSMLMPLSIVDMPIAVQIKPKLQTFYTAHMADNVLLQQGSEPQQMATEQSATNLDIGVALQPLPGLVLGVSGSNLIAQDIDVYSLNGAGSYDFQLTPIYNAAVAYQWRSISLISDIELNANQGFEEIEDSQYVRFAGALKATDWLSVSLGYSHDILAHQADIYTIGTGMSFGPSFSVDFTGLVGGDEALGGVLKTSYHF
ncbi:conjugal transfer protein TraF [Shewanella waksmanii]|uniref:conjugal transfer protein TraF n=1 Tax=Shewanella waksmanii TaxID=213783 RepID=UPI003736DAFD